MNRVNYQTTIDGCHPVRDKFDHHHAVTSPGYSPHSKHSLQQTKMPALLLRLDSAGEVSTVNLPSDSTTSNNLSKVNSRPVLHSQSFESDIVSKAARRLFSSSGMAKLLCPRNSVTSGSVQIGSHNLGLKSHAESDAFYGMKSFSSSLDSCQKNYLLHDMNSILMPCKINEYNVLGSHGHQIFKDLETNLLPAVSCSLTTSIFSIAKACAACHTTSSGCSVSASARSTPSDKDSSSPVTVSPEIQITDVLCQNCEGNTSSLGICAADESSLSVAFQPESKIDESSLSVICQSESVIDEFSRKREDVAGGEKVLTVETVFDGECKQTEECSRSCDKLKSDSSQNSTSDEACLSSSTPSLSYVLLTPRKTTRKGRPSSKKQRKRQRERQKTCAVPSLSKLTTTDDAGNRQQLSHCSQSEDNDSSSILFVASCSQSHRVTPRESTPVKSQAKHCPIASFFFGGKSDSEEADDSDGSDICEDAGEWAASEDEKMLTIPKKCAGINAPLNLDSVFKRKSIPTLKSVFWAEESESESESSPVASSRGCQSSSLATSKDDHSGDSSVDHSGDSSVEFSSPASSPLKSFGFSCGLSIEALFTKKPDLVCSTAVQESVFDTVDGASSDAEVCQLSTGFELCYEPISRINARWNKDYPSAGFRSCLAISSDEVKDPSIKVHFASGASFQTIHLVGSEERGGIWHHFALDRERFQRRIHDLASVLSPVLEASHRAKIVERNHHN